MKEEEGGTLTKPNHLLIPRGSVRHVLYSVKFATLLLDYIQLSLASYSIISVLHRSGDSYLGESNHLTTCPVLRSSGKLNQRRCLTGKN